MNRHMQQIDHDMKVMWAMLARLDYENLIQVNQAEVAEQVGMNRHNVNRSIKEADRARCGLRALR